MTLMDPFLVIIIKKQGHKIALYKFLIVKKKSQKQCILCKYIMYSFM